MDEKTWYVVDVNPRPWVVGPLSVARSGKGMYPKMGRNQELYDYQQAVVETLRLEYPNLKSLGEIGTLWGRREVEIALYFWQQIEVSEREDRLGRKRTYRGHNADLTNMVKAAEDAVAGLFFDNDVQVRAQRNVIMDRGEHIPQGLVVMSVEGFSGPDPDELPDFVWQKVEPILHPGVLVNGEDLKLF